MKYTIIYILLILNFSSFSQIDTSIVLQGEWRLKYYKESTSLLEFDQNLEKETKINNDSTIILKITKDSISIMRKSLFRIDTIKYTFKIKKDTSKLFQKSAYNYSLIMYPSKKMLRAYRKKKLRKYHEELRFFIPKLTNSQLVLKSLVIDNLHFNPFFQHTSKDYYFEKINNKSKSELNFKGQWFCNSKEFNVFKDLDTIKLYKDTVNQNIDFNFEIDFNIEPFKENSINLHEINLKENRYLIAFNFYNWTLLPLKEQLLIKANKEQIKFTYTFKNNRLLLIRNGS